MSITATVEGGDVPPSHVSKSWDTRSSDQAPAVVADSARGAPVSRASDRSRMVASPQNLVAVQGADVEADGRASSPPVALRMPNLGTEESYEESDIMTASEFFSDSLDAAPASASDIHATFILPDEQPHAAFDVPTDITSAAGADQHMSFRTSQPQPAQKNEAPVHWLYESSESHDDIPLDVANPLFALPHDTA